MQDFIKQFQHNFIWNQIPVPLGSGTLSGFIPFKTQIASITSLTPDGGLFIDFTNVIS